MKTIKEHLNNIASLSEYDFKTIREAIETLSDYMDEKETLNKEIAEAKETLKSDGYFTGSLWHIDDVSIKEDHYCVHHNEKPIMIPSKKVEILTHAVNNGFIKGWINEEIEYQVKKFYQKSD